MMGFAIWEMSSADFGGGVDDPFSILGDLKDGKKDTPTPPDGQPSGTGTPPGNN
jgi:hypothetical protein